MRRSWWRSRWRSGWRSWWLAAGLLGAGCAVAGLCQWRVPDKRLYTEVAPALLALVAGVLAAAAVLAVAASRAAARTRLAAADARARADVEQTRRRFTHRLDHELKNPLTALITALSGPPGPLDERSRDVAHAQADRLRRLLADLRRVADVETVELYPVRVPTATLIRDAVDAAVADHATGRGSPREVHVDVPAAPRPVPDLLGDGDLLFVAVYNVVANALKYSAAGDAVEVRARELAGPLPRVLVEVADAGPGIPPDEQAVVWEELARGRGAAGLPGSGIGLALVRIIVRRHGGDVALHSAGRGTSVQLYLVAA